MDREPNFKYLEELLDKMEAAIEGMRADYRKKKRIKRARRIQVEFNGHRAHTELRE